MSPTWYPVEVEGVESGSMVFQGRSEYYVNCHIQVGEYIVSKPCKAVAIWLANFTPVLSARELVITDGSLSCLTKILMHV